MTTTSFRRTGTLQHALALGLSTVVTTVVLQGVLGLAARDHAAQLAQQAQATQPATALVRTARVAPRA